MTWLVTGGAGYIGSHVVRALRSADLQCVVIDDLSSGHEQFVPRDVPFVLGTILDGSLVLQTLQDYEVTGVIHVAGFKYAGVSVQEPLRTYEQNVTGTARLLAAMESADVDRIVFSSSAAVYGTPDTDLVTEETPKNPQSPYGESKLIGEWLLADQGVARGLHHTSLRYFNVVGSGDPSLYDSSPHNLFPLVFTALVEGRTPRINGNDYPTPDGTNVRDYIHVVDLAASHVARPSGWTLANRSSPPTTSAAATGCRSARSWRRWPRSPASRSHPRSLPGVPAIPPASSPRATSRRATWIGGCATPCARWSRRNG